MRARASVAVVSRSQRLCVGDPRHLPHFKREYFLKIMFYANYEMRPLLTTMQFVSVIFRYHGFFKRKKNNNDAHLLS